MDFNFGAGDIPFLISDLGNTALGWYRAVSGDNVSTVQTVYTPTGSTEIRTGAAATQAQSNMMWIIVVLAVVVFMMWRK